MGPPVTMLSKLADWGASVVLGLALGAAIVVGVSSLAGVTWFGGNTEVDGWHVSHSDGPETVDLVRGTETLPLDINVSRADLDASDYPGPLGFGGEYSDRIPADRPFEIRFTGHGNVSNMTARITLPAYYDTPGEAPPEPGGAAHAECDVEEPENETKNYSQGRLVVNVTETTCRFTVNLSQPLDLSPEGDHGGEEINVGTTWLSDAGMRFQARWLEAEG